jgi:hypothetical protein
VSTRADRAGSCAVDASVSPAPVAHPDALLGALHEIRNELAELRAAIAPDLAQRVVVLHSLRCEFGTENFTALDALERAAERPDSEFARALVPLLGGPVGGLRRLSRRLAKLAGKPAGGVALVRVGDDRGSALYVIQNGSLGRFDRHARGGPG